MENGEGILNIEKRMQKRRKATENNNEFSDWSLPDSSFSTLSHLEHLPKIKLKKNRISGPHSNDSDSESWVGPKNLNSKQASLSYLDGSDACSGEGTLGSDEKQILEV